MGKARKGDGVYVRKSQEEKRDVIQFLLLPKEKKATNYFRKEIGILSLEITDQIIIR